MRLFERARNVRVEGGGEGMVGRRDYFFVLGVEMEREREELYVFLFFFVFFLRGFILWGWDSLV